MPSLEEMKAMADKKAFPLLEKLKSDSNSGGVSAECDPVGLNFWFRQIVRRDPNRVLRPVLIQPCLVPKAPR